LVDFKNEMQSTFCICQAEVTVILIEKSTPGCYIYDGDSTQICSNL